MKLAPVSIPLNNLLLDPNNYRFRDSSDFYPVPENKFHLEANQNRALSLLKADNVDLVRSIKANGFLEVERVVVAKYDETEQYYVIEGNRRIAALKQIQQELASALFSDPALAATIEAVPCLVAESAEEVPGFKESLMGIRHVGGIRQWGGYQRAQLIAELRNTHQLESTAVAERLGLSVHEVNRRYRAYSALRQLLDDDEYGDRGRPTMYPLFHEAVAIPTIRDWLGWNDATGAFDKVQEKEQFYGLITTSEDEEGVKKEAKLSTYQDVRQLREILQNPQAKSYLLDPDAPFSQAIAAANQAEVQKKWRDEVKQASAAIQNITALEMLNMDNADKQLLSKLKSTIETLLNNFPQTPA